MSKAIRHYVLVKNDLSDGSEEYFVNIYDYQTHMDVDFFSEQLGPFKTRREAFQEAVKLRKRARIVRRDVVADFNDDEVDQELRSHNETPRR